MTRMYLVQLRSMPWFRKSYASNVGRGCSADDSRSLNNRGLEATRSKWESHWSRALTDDDLYFLTNTAHVNHIRLPVGYWILGPDFCANTPFAVQPAEVYVNAWTAVKSICSRCLSHGIGVLIDLHAGPGGFGHEPHSGSMDGKAEFWNEDFNKGLATRCIIFIAEQVTQDPQLAGVTGIQICNEAIWDAPGMYEWYNEIIQKVSKIDNTIPLYISDGWDMPRALKFTRAYNTTEHKETKCPAIVDNHRYYCFDSKDTSRSPQELTEQVRHDLWELDDSLTGNVFDLKAAVAVYIGEYSMALNPGTWSKAPSEQHEDLKRTFGHAQSKRWQVKAMGSAFWTLKMDWMPGGDWGLKEQVHARNVQEPKNMCLSEKEIRDRVRAADEKRGQLLGQAMKDHTEFWERTAPAGQFEHWRFADGWGVGWTDARAFFVARVEHVVPCKGSKMVVQGGGGHEVGGECCEPPEPNAGSGWKPEETGISVEQEVGSKGWEQIGADRIGALDLWVLKRMREVGVARREECAFGWEWEQGFRKGVRAFEVVVGID